MPKRLSYVNHTTKTIHYSSSSTTTSLNAKINEVKSEIPIITNLPTNTVLTAVQNKIPSVSNLVKKADYNTKVNEIEKKITGLKGLKY